MLVGWSLLPLFKFICAPDEEISSDIDHAGRWRRTPGWPVRDRRAYFLERGRTAR